MLARRIIPCLDVKDGQVVKGVKFRNHEVVGDIVELARRYADEGADELVFYDIAASTRGETVEPAWVSAVARVIDIPRIREVTNFHGYRDYGRRMTRASAIAFTGSRRTGAAFRQCKTESRTLVGTCRFHPDLATMIFDNSP
ncbi:MAG: HisA/HisF-related TIM barrel protein, partial [Pseudomonadota bacterium]|nr:HisA/HisF-related TIM barrel protein [Pseudomonadota bacterium]